MAALFKRFADELQWRYTSFAARMTDRDPVTGIRMTRRNDLVNLGTIAAGWMVPAYALNKGSVCYCAGVGYDLSFELELIRRFWCRVFGFDPSPRAKGFVARIGAEAVGYDFHRMALGDRDEIRKFSNAGDTTYIGIPATNDVLRTEKHYETPCRRVATVMNEWGHGSLALLKLDLDSGTHAVVNKMLDDGIRPSILCLAFADGTDSERGVITQTLQTLVESDDYALVATDGRRRFTLLFEGSLN